MSIQKLFAILVAFAVLLAPAFTRAGEAFAAVPDHHALMLESGHCEDAAPVSGKDEGTKAKNCCMSMCTAVAVTFTAAQSERDLRHSPAVFTARPFLMGLPAEIATPPPRSAWDVTS